MANNVTLPGSGQVVASDDISGVQYQRVKLVDGTEDSTNAIPGDATNGLKVDVSRVGASENHIGEVGGRMAMISANFTRPANTTQYTAGDVVGDGSVITFSSIARINDSSGVILHASLIDEANQTTKLLAELWLFRATVTADSDNAVFTPTDAELQTFVGIIPFNVGFVGDAQSGNSGNVAFPVSVNMPFKCTGGIDDLFGVLVARNAYTPISGEVFRIILTVVQD